MKISLASSRRHRVGPFPKNPTLFYSFQKGIRKRSFVEDRKNKELIIIEK